MSVSNLLAAITENTTETLISDEQALALLNSDGRELLLQAAALRDSHFHNVVTYSKKVFLPLTHLCRDVCHYCTFAQTPKFIQQAYMPLEEVLEQVRQAKILGCNEALFTLGEKPELRYQTARKALDDMGFASTLEYLAHVAKAVFEHSGILPHINAGCMTDSEFKMLKPYAASMGIMLESVSSRLCEKGMPHYGSPDKDPVVRLETLRLAGENDVPFTTGILIGIGETRLERIESLLAIRAIHQQYGHIQEIIIQNFKAKPNTQMANAPEPDLAELLWTIAVARLIFGATMSIQAPPNLSPGVLEQIIAAGINDWGGVSPLTPDFVNPEAPWPHLKNLASETLLAGKVLQQRLTIYPQFIAQRKRYLHPNLQAQVLALVDAAGLVREDDWLSGTSDFVPEAYINNTALRESLLSADVQGILAKAQNGQLLQQSDIVRLFQARGEDFRAVCAAADALRKTQVGDAVSFTVNRNINYTNICYFKCKFCAFSKGKLSEDLRGKPYDLSKDEIQRRVKEAWARGATEVCMQGGIHPSYTGQTYLDLCQMVKEAEPEMHIHAFSPLEVWHGAATLNLSLEEYLRQLQAAGLSTLPGTAAEVLDDEVREDLCADKINSAQWLEVMRVAHKVGLKTTATIMFGHIDHYQHWANHLIKVRDLQRSSGGFTEFVPLSFVASESPIFIKGQSRKGPTFREAMLMHAIARLSLSPYIVNIQASWVKLGRSGAAFALVSGANDLGGTLMNESITRSAGAAHGEELDIEKLAKLVTGVKRHVRYRNTYYHDMSASQLAKAREAAELQVIELSDVKRGMKAQLLHPGDSLDPRDSKFRT